MSDLDSNPADAGTEQSGIAQPKSVAELYLDEDEEALEAAPSASEGEAQPEETADEADQAEEASEGEEVSEEDEAEGEDGDGDSKSIEIDGKNYTLDEVKTGFMLQADYTRKTQALAAERSEFAAAIERVVQQDATARQAIEFADAVIRAIMPPDPDASTLDSDPVGFMKAQEARRQVEAALRQLHAQRDTVEQQSQELTREQTKKLLNQEWEITTQKLPELATRDGQAKFRSKAVDFGQKHWGLTSAEIDGIQSHKELLVLKDAIAYRELMAKKPAVVEKVKSAPKIAPPGARTKPADAASKLRALGRSARPSDFYLHDEV